MAEDWTEAAIPDILAVMESVVRIFGTQNIANFDYIRYSEIYNGAEEELIRREYYD